MADKVSNLLLFGATGDLARRMLLPSLYGARCRRAAAARFAHRRHRAQRFRRRCLSRTAPRRARRPCPRRILRPRGGGPIPRAGELCRARRDAARGLRAAGPEDRPGHGLAIFLSTAPSLFKATIDGLVRRRPERPARAPRARKAARQRPGLEPRDQRRRRRAPFPSSASSASTITSARKRCRTCSPCASATRCSSRCGTRRTSTMSRSPSPRPSGSRAAPTITTAPARCATWSRTTCCSCSPGGDGAAGQLRRRPRCATKRSRCCARCARSAPRTSATPCAASMARARSTARSVAGYADELGRASDTETFVALRAHVDNWRWAGRAVLPAHRQAHARARAPKSSSSSSACPIRCSPRAAATLKPNRLVIRLQPEENIRLLVMAKTPGLDRDGMRLREVPLDIEPGQCFRRHAPPDRL